MKGDRYRDTDRSRKPGGEIDYSKRYKPESLPFTTAASEFLYGYSVVSAAIKAGRRKLYKLYIHERGMNNEGFTGLMARAKMAKLNVQEVGDDYLPLLDKASNGRPHNVRIV